MHGCMTSNTYIKKPPSVLNLLYALCLSERISVFDWLTALSELIGLPGLIKKQKHSVVCFPGLFLITLSSVQLTYFLLAQLLP